MAVFTWDPEWGCEKQPRTNKVVHQFGDGYSQVQAVGMNSQAEDWRLSFNTRTDSEADEIETFLRANDTVSFSWTPPGEVTAKKYRCASEDWKRIRVKYNVNNITARFVQVFEP